MNADRPVTVLDRLREVLDFARSADPRAPMTRRAVIVDCAIAAAVLALSLSAVQLAFSGQSTAILGYATKQPFPVPFGWPSVLAAVATSAPLALRRRFPLAAYALLLVGGLAIRRYTTDVAFFSVVFAAYSAIAYSRFRGAALLIVPPAWMVAVAVLWLTPAPHLGVGVLGPAHPHWILVAVLVLASMVTIMAIGYAVHAGDSRARLKTEHEATTRRVLELERARIAGELHDVVTHNVSVMIVQAGAARQVLADAPDDAWAALLAVEASGRAAMAELRHLLGLLSPAPPEQADPALEPQPGVGQLRVLVDRLASAGLPAELHMDIDVDLSPGLDLAVYRVVQEALTNVIKHAGKPRTSVKLREGGGDLVIEVADAGRPIPAAAPAAPAAPAASAVPAGTGRGLAGLRERLAVYGGELEAGPAPDGGWVVRARIPAGPVPPGVAGASRLASASGRG